MVPPAQAEMLLPFEETLLSGIFADANPVLLSALKNKFHTTLTTVQSQMYSEVTSRGWFRRSPERARRGWTTLGSILVGAGLVLGGFLGFTSAETDQIGGVSFGIPSGFVLAGGLLVGGVIIGLLGRRMAARTADGSAVLAQSLGFQAVSRDCGGPPDQVRGGTGHLQPLPALCDRVRRGRPLGRHLLPGRRGGHGSGSVHRHAGLVRLRGQRGLQRLLGDRLWDGLFLDHGQWHLHQHPGLLWWQWLQWGAVSPAVAAVVVAAAPGRTALVGC
jgi:hypothetical protein